LGGGPNVYAYCMSNPLAYIDPLGLCGDQTYGFGFGDYLDDVDQFLYGEGDAIVGALQGLANFVMSPSQSTMDAMAAIASLDYTIAGIADSIATAWDSGYRGQGQLVGGTLIAAATIAAPYANAGFAPANVSTLDANAIRFSQSNVRASLADITQSMRANGWQGPPIDVVRLPDGALIAVDNTRLAAASLSGTPVQAIIRGFNETLPAARAGGNLQGATWGEAVLNRVGAQKPAWQRLYPYGSPYTGIHPSTTGL